MIKYFTTPQCVLRQLERQRGRLLQAEADRSLARAAIMEAEINCARIKLQAELNAKKVVSRFLKK